MTKKPALGRGFDALLHRKIPAVVTDTTSVSVTDKQQDNTINTNSDTRNIPIESIVQNSRQPRAGMNQEELKALADSIASSGVLQPILVRKMGDKYELVAGERRWRACQLLGMKTLPAVVRNDISDQDSLIFAIIENVQRNDLNAIDEARAYSRLSTDFGMSQDQVAASIGKSRSTVANSVRLLNLDNEVQQLVIDGKISQGHARPLLALQAGEQRKWSHHILDKSLSVRETEELVRKVIEKDSIDDGRKDIAQKIDKDIHVQEIEEGLQHIFGTKVKIKYAGKKKSISIEYYSNDDLDRILSLIYGRVEK